MFDVIDGQISPMAITIDYSAYYLSGALFRVNQFNRDWTSTLSYKETPGSFDINFNVTQLYNNTNITIVRQRCFCVEDYCNNNITTCLNANTTIPLENSAIRTNMNDQKVNTYALDCPVCCLPGGDCGKTCPCGDGCSKAGCHGR
ncbi:unnamed protein product [Adineta steineri]|uniref:Uncharacterized protein n=2 Tax=Adineta steineri TaxID=433720 RepID=A0A813YYR5_9BILA|nr:unnamed protein product [Adineta steineri]